MEEETPHSLLIQEPTAADDADFSVQVEDLDRILYEGEDTTEVMVMEEEKVEAFDLDSPIEAAGSANEEQSQESKDLIIDEPDAAVIPVAPAITKPTMEQDFQDAVAARQREQLCAGNSDPRDSERQKTKTCRKTSSSSLAAGFGHFGGYGLGSTRFDSGAPSALMGAKQMDDPQQNFAATSIITPRYVKP